MNSVIFRTWMRFLQPVILLISIFFLLRGHNEPGGGFIGGLVAGAALSLNALAWGSGEARKALGISPHHLMAWGLLTALVSGLAGLFRRGTFLAAEWTTIELPIIGTAKAGTPLLFDVGVYLLVFGMVLTLVFNLLEGEAESEKDEHGT
jgi:multicomponent Na+:H+ antiporter subunit B